MKSADLINIQHGVGSSIVKSDCHSHKVRFGTFMKFFRNILEILKNTVKSNIYIEKLIVFV